MTDDLTQLPRDPRLMRLRQKLVDQAADLVNKAKIPPAVLATELLNIAIALPTSMGVPPREVAIALRAHAALLDPEDGGEGPLN